MVPILAAGVALGAPWLSAAYLGDFVTHPGASFRMDQEVTDAFRLEAELAAWWHPNNFLGTQLRAGPAVRVVGPRGGTWGGFVHAGVLRGWWDTPTYVVEGGQAATRPLHGDNWFTVTPGIELGHTLATDGLDSWFARPQLGLRIPTFHGAGLDAAVEVGVRWGGAA